MFSAKIVAQLLHKRKHHSERAITYIPGNQVLQAEQNMNYNQLGNDYYERQMDDRMNQQYVEYGY